MSSHLHAVNLETGELVDHDCRNCEDKDLQIGRLLSDISSLKRQITMLESDPDRDAREHELYSEGASWHATWREKCRHPRCEYGPEEFWLILPFLKHKTKRKFIGQAIEGAAFDPHFYRRKNGTVKRCDEWTRIFKKDGSHFREFCAKAPKEATDGD